MRYKHRAVYFEHEYIINNPYLTTVHELHLALVTHDVNGETHAVALVHMPCLGKELDVERQAGYVACRLWRIVAGDTTACARVVPLPLFHVAAKFGKGLCRAHILIFEWRKFKMYESIYFLVCDSFYASCKHLLAVAQYVRKEDVA